jgi:hypothetical protein
MSSAFHLPAIDADLDEELRLAKARLDELRHRRKLRTLARAKQRALEGDEANKAHRKTREQQSPSESDYLYGAAAIGAVTGQTAGRVYYWYKAGLYGDAVWKAGHRTLMGSRSKLQNLGPRDD